MNSMLMPLPVDGSPVTTWMLPGVFLDIFPLEHDRAVYEYEDDECYVEELAWILLGHEAGPEDDKIAFEMLEARISLRKDDPMAPQNMTRYHPLVNDSPLARCVLTGRKSRKKQVYVLVSAWRFEWANAHPWNMNNDKSGGRYVRRNPSQHDKKAGRGKTVYLYREIMMQMLREDPELLAENLKKFRLVASGLAQLDIERLMAVAIVHHRNHDPEDCRDINLELVTEQENRQQAQSKRGANGYDGVHRFSKTGNDGKPHWHYRAQVTTYFQNGRERRLRLGVFVTPELALLACALWKLAHPRTMPKAFTPTAKEAPVWACAKRFAEGKAQCEVFGAVRSLPKDLRKYVLYAKIQHKKGKTAKVLERC